MHFSVSFEINGRHPEYLNNISTSPKGKPRGSSHSAHRHVVVISDCQLCVGQDRPLGLQLHHDDLAVDVVLLALQPAHEVGVAHVRHAGVVYQGDQRVQSSGVYIGDFELEAVCEQDPDNPPGQTPGQPQRPGHEEDHPLRGAPHLLVPVPLLVVVHIL